ncbi:MAG: metal ABC transporter permease [Betaproteobacteria bacterium]|nr:metal ABC transporter permease [Betaproteobacteria bacterium]
MRHALAGSLAVSIGCAPLGVFLVLRRLSLASDAVAHALLPGIAVGYLLAGFSIFAMLVGGIVSAMVVALTAGLISRLTILKEDANLAALYLGSLALGVLLISLRENRVDLHSILFGSVLAIGDSGLLLLVSVASISLLVLAAIYRPLLLEFADPSFLRQISRSGMVAYFVFIVLVVVNLASASQAQGTLLAISAMIMPAATARFWVASVGSMIGVAMFIGCASSVVGLTVSLYLNIPAGPAIVMAAVIFYLLSLVFGSREGLLARYAPRRHLAA